MRHGMVGSPYTSCTRCRSIPRTYRLQFAFPFGNCCSDNSEWRSKGVLDIDSDQLSTFDETDRVYLEKVVDLLIRELYTQK